MDTRLQHRLYLVARRLCYMQVGWTLALVWGGSALLGLILLQFSQAVVIADVAIWIWLGATACHHRDDCRGPQGRFRDLTCVATVIEQKFPALNQRLLTSLQLKPNLPNGRYGYLQRSVISETVRHDFR